MTAYDDICFASAHQLAQRIRRREVSPIEVAEAVIAQIEGLNDDVVAYCALDHDRVRAAAVEAERQLARSEPSVPPWSADQREGPIFTSDFPTAGGSKAYVDFVPDEDDVVVERVRRAGASCGKTNVPDSASAPR